MSCRPEQREMIALSVNVHKLLADPGEGARGYCSAIDPGDVPPRCTDISGQDKHAILGLDPSFVEQEPQSFSLERAGDIEDCLDRGSPSAVPDEIGRCPSAEYGPKRVDDDRLAGAGLTGQGVEAGSKGDPEITNNGKVSDGQFEEH